MNSSYAVPVPPQEAITNLSKLKLSGSAMEGGMDTLVLTVGTEAYSTTESDSVFDLATAWKWSEFNIFGDGSGSEAIFNSGSSITVKVAVSNGTEDAPICVSNEGRTEETNNLNLGSCAGTGGAQPYIEFIESIAPATLTPAILSFGNEAIGDPSVPKTATLLNKQTVPLMINSIAVSGGTATTDYTWGGNCPISPNTLGAKLSLSDHRHVHAVGFGKQHSVADRHR